MKLKLALKNLFAIAIFAMVLLLPAMDSKAATPEEEAVKYTYEVTPICGQMGYFLYLKTDNPDVSALCLIDEANPKEFYRLSSSQLFVDVKYENESTFRVPGGYIFCCTNMSTGDTRFKTLEAGYFSLKVVKQNSIDKAVDTGIRIAHPKLYDSVDYILDTYTDSSMDFWAKMEAAQAAVMKIALYPFAIYDLDQPTDGIYPRIIRSMYNDRTSSEVYPSYGGAFETVNALIYNAFPYMTNSASTPFLMSNIATRLEPSCTFELSEASHAYIIVTWNGKTDSYGGTGEHGNQFIILDEKIYTFDGSENDYSQNKSIMDYRAKLAKVREEGGPKYSAAVSGNGSLAEVQKKGGWSSIYSFFGVDYIFYANPYYDYRVFNTWVDGRYVDGNGFYTLNGQGNNPTFKDHPDANIFLRNVTFTNAKGETLTDDVYYEYVPSMDKWYSFSAYEGKYARWSGKEGGLPDELILTREEVEKMNLDYASGKAPEYYRIYDGSARPGTEKNIVNVTGLSFSQSRVRVTPKVATDKSDIKHVDVILSPNTGNKIYNIKRNTEKEAPECAKIITLEPGQSGTSTNQIAICSVALDMQPGEYKLYYTTYDGNYTAVLKVVVGDDDMASVGDLVVGPDGSLLYYEDGIHIANKYGFALVDGVKLLIANGKYVSSINGLYNDPENPDDWYYCSEGRAQTQYTGLCSYDGAWFYVKSGKMDTKTAGFVEYDGGLFYVGVGRIMTEVNGLALDPATKAWYYLAGGQVQTQYTGLAMYDNAWFYVRNGKLADDYTGTVEYDGVKFNVENGMLH